MPRLRATVLTALLFLTVACATAATEVGQPPAVSATGPGATPRPIAVVSDFHMGVGRTAGKWSNLEDFRWTNAFRAFLDAIGRQYGDGVDLVVGGDLLELWQHPTVVCSGCGPDLGCALAEIERVSADVIAQHTPDLRALGAFADRGTNRVFVIPGNHDAAIQLDTVWQRLRDAIGSVTGRVVRVDDAWVSPDGLVVVEHGHQIGDNPNRFRRWPAVTGECAADGGVYVDRPWGEFFVQKLFNEAEDQHPLIDNLIPESAGAGLYSRRQGVVASSVDLARFIAFTLFQTSLWQKLELNVADPSKADAWDLKVARQRGARLFADAMGPDDPLRAQLLEGATPRAVEIRESLDALSKDPAKLSDAAVLALCDQIKIRAQREPGTRQLCSRDLFLGTARSFFPLNRVLAPHLAARLKAYPDTRIFIYGHTHEADFDIAVSPTPTRNVTAFNSGAFQRLMDQATFRQRAAAKGSAPEDAFAAFTLEADFPACYSAILVTYDRSGVPQPALRHWLMPESEPTGEFVLPCDLRCGAGPPRCRAQ